MRMPCSIAGSSWSIARIEVIDSEEPACRCFLPWCWACHRSGLWRHRQWDGDLSFEPHYFERLLDALVQNPRLGITCGNIHVEVYGRWTPEEYLMPWTSGPSKVYRRACFEAIGGLRRSLGWDGVDNWHALMLGWEVGRDKRLTVLHHRPPGTAAGSLKGRIEEGRGAYFIGYHPLFMLARGYPADDEAALRHRGCAMISGYVSSAG